jgi:surfeit locus 1 family protein
MSSTTRRLIMGLLLLAAAGFASLGVWQLGRLRERRAANIVTTAARAAAPIALTDGALTAAETLAGRRLVARGVYDHRHDIVIRNQPFQGVPGVRLVTPLRLADGRAVLVDRGFLPAPDAVSVEPDSFREPGERTVRGLAVPVSSGAGEPIVHGGRTTWKRLDLQALRTRLPYAVLPILIRQTPDSTLASFPRRVEAPPIDEGPHLGYAMQWFLFSAMAVAFALLVVGRGR